MARLLIALLTASLLGGCIVLPLDHYDGRGGHRHRHWSERHYDDGSSHRPHREWRYRDRY